MGELRSKMESAMRLRNFSPKTIKSYLLAIKSFARYFGKDPRVLGVLEIEQYLYEIIKEGKSWSHFRQISCALRFLYCIVLEQEWMRNKIPFPRRNKTLPKYLSREEIKQALKVVENPKHRLMLEVIYATGIRVGELVNLKVTDIDSSRMLLRIASGKGLKERYTLLPQVLLKKLREYWKEYRPAVYLFENKSGAPHSVTVVQKACNKITKKCGVKISPHIIRHSFATALLEQGEELITISKLLGHSNLKTTERYAQVTPKKLSRTVSPLELI